MLAGGLGVQCGRNMMNGIYEVTQDVTAVQRYKSRALINEKHKKKLLKLTLLWKKNKDFSYETKGLPLLRIQSTHTARILGWLRFYSFVHQVVVDV